MNRINVLPTLLFCVVTMVLSAHAQERVIETRTLGIIKSESGANKLDVEVTIYQRPKFYRGPMPLKFLSRRQFVGSGGAVTLEHRHNNWTNTYRYTDHRLAFSGVATESQAATKSGRLLAEAKFLQVLKGQGIEIEETHFSDTGKVIFRCRSLIDFEIGFKQREQVITGSKTNDYFFVWPVSTQGGT